MKLFETIKAVIIVIKQRYFSRTPFHLHPSSTRCIFKTPFLKLIWKKTEIFLCPERQRNQMHFEKAAAAKLLGPATETKTDRPDLDKHLLLQI